MDYLTIDHLVVQGAHGHYDHERTREQSFHIAVRVGTHLKRAGQSDTLADTIDYDAIKGIVLDTFAHESRYLIESLAETIARRILQETPALEATVSIKKPEAWDNGIPGVSITRKA